MRFSRFLPTIVLAAVMLAPQTALAFELFPGDNPAGDFRDYVIAFYNFSIAAGILIATVLIMIGGMIWVTSAGNASRVELAKSYIIDSIIGVILLLGAVVILRLINPALVELPKFAPNDLGGPSGSCIYMTSGTPSYRKCESASDLYCREGLKGTFQQGKTCNEVCPLKQGSPNIGECGEEIDRQQAAADAVSRARFCVQFSTSGQAVNERVRDSGRFDTRQNCQTYCEERSNVSGINFRCSGSYDDQLGRCNCS